MDQRVGALGKPCCLRAVRASPVLARQHPSSQHRVMGLEVTTAGNEGEEGAGGLSRFLNYFFTLTSSGLVSTWGSLDWVGEEVPREMLLAILQFGQVGTSVMYVQIRNRWNFIFQAGGTGHANCMRF